MNLVQNRSNAVYTGACFSLRVRVNISRNALNIRRKARSMEVKSNRYDAKKLLEMMVR